MNATLPDTVLIIDASLADLPSLLADAGDHARTRIVGPGEDALRSITEELARGPAVALHLVGHGAPGRITLGGQVIDAVAIRERAALTQSWAEPLAGGDILIYGCNSGAGDRGQALIHALSEMTGATVHASGSVIGRTPVGPNWDLDISSRAGAALPRPVFSADLRASYPANFAEVTFSLSPNYVTEVPAPGETEATIDFVFELDEVPAEGATVWLYATEEENGALGDALRGDRAANEFDIFKALSTDYYDGIQYPIVDRSVEAGLSQFSDQYVFEITILEAEGRLTLVGFDDTDYYGDPRTDNPRSYYWNVIDAPEDGVVHTIVDGSQYFTEYHSIDDVPANIAPVATDDSAETAYGSNVRIRALSNDSDDDGDSLSLASVTQPNKGSVEISGGALVYSPDRNASGRDSFTYTISDGNGGTDTATVSLMVGGKFVGTGGANTIKAGGGDDLMSGRRGNDTLKGLAGDDRINGDKGKDALFGGGGKDSLNGGIGKDVLQGGNGNDDLRGGGGNDTVKGGNGKDTLLGGKGNDTLVGGKGNDTFNGNAGNDTLTGNKGADRFVFNKNWGRDTITDFDTGQRGEKIVLDEVNRMKQFLRHAEQDGQDVVYDKGDDGQNVLRIEDLTLSDLSGNDFIFG
ncbi:MAG: DUF4347 domain-containing protein [Pseudooceanicola nanhaiensis]